MGTLKRSEQITLAVGLLATAAAGVSRYAGAPAVLAFLLAAVALAALSSIVSFATEQVGERFGPADQIRPKFQAGRALTLVSSGDTGVERTAGRRSLSGRSLGVRPPPCGESSR